MATARADPNPRLTAQASVLKAWGREWRRANGKGQQELGRLAGYGSDESPKSAAVAISRIESGKTDPTGRYRRRLLDALGHTEAELEEETERALAALSRPGVFARAMAGPIYIENEARRAQIIASSNLLTERVTFQVRNSERTLERACNGFVLPFLETAARLDWQRRLDTEDAGATDETAGSLEGEIRQLRGQTEAAVLKALTESTAGAGAGGGPGSGTAAGVLVALSAAGTASTGAAIASLSGAAASSTTLAWLGSGSLAAGRMGVAGGAAVLTGIVALPALLAIGGVLVWKGRKLRKEAEAEAEKLDAAQQALEDMQDALPRAEKWNEAQQAIIQRAELLGRAIRSRAAEAPPFIPAPGDDASRRIEWDALSPDAQKALEIELKLVSIILDTQALPVWLGVTSVNEPDLTPSQEETATKSEEWIDESLTLARSDLDEYEEWVRRLVAHDSPN
ncbi:helix-turn-helix domain-containing protein [Agromyces arachidis]|uniref:helix-turn-helix domain-containing protein n=1 Tax=Agromyces arachidis TaxID=766966 RepID=UPI004055FB76